MRRETGPRSIIWAQWGFPWWALGHVAIHWEMMTMVLAFNWRATGPGHASGAAVWRFWRILGVFSHWDMVGALLMTLVMILLRRIVSTFVG